MIIVALSDIHGQVESVTESSPVASDLENADILVISGDITNFGDAAEAAKVISRLRRYNSSVFAVPGNCDSSEVDEYLRAERRNLHCNLMQFGKLGFTGVGGVLPCPRDRQSEDEVPEISICLEHIAKLAPAGMKMVFVCHYPPFGTCVDMRGSSRHVGSQDVRDFILDYEPVLAITGHIHESAGVDRLGGTTVVNPGSFGQGSYAVITISEKVDSVVLKQL